MRNLTISVVLSGFLGFLVALSPALAAKVYENPWDNLIIDSGAFSHNNQQLADVFLLGSGTSINRATWYGTMFSQDPLDTGDVWNFDLNVFAADGGAGLPGSELAINSVVASVTDTGIDIGGERAYLFDASFSSLALLGSTNYWFSVVNTGTQNTFRWTRATAGLGTAIRYGNNAGWSNFSNSTRTPLNFSLYDGGTTAVVPLPAALPLFGTGLAILGFAGLRRRRRIAAA